MVAIAATPQAVGAATNQGVGVAPTHVVTPEEYEAVMEAYSKQNPYKYFNKDSTGVSKEDRMKKVLAGLKAGKPMFDLIPRSGPVVAPVAPAPVAPVVEPEEPKKKPK